MENLATIFMVYLSGAIIVAAYAQHVHKNGITAFLGSLLLTPVIGLLLVASNVYTCKHCKHVSTVYREFCPVCGKDNKGVTLEQYKTKAATK
jgi:rubrerythrin